MQVIQSKAPPRIAVTGSNGFIGSNLIINLISRGFFVRGLFRDCSQAPQNNHPRFEVASVGQINSETIWSGALSGIDTVIHCAAITQLSGKLKSRGSHVFSEINTDGTRRLATEAVRAGVRRLIFISSLKVHGEVTPDSRAVTVGDLPNPMTPYAVSKLEAERSLFEISRSFGLEVVVIRPPPVYGRGVKGSFATLTRLLGAGIPFPLSAVDNRRSFIGIDNLVDFLIRCVDHPSVAGQTLLVSDGQDVSTPELLRVIANAMKRPARLFPVPPPLLRLIGQILGFLSEVERLVGSLEVDSSATRELLGWAPPVSLEEGIRRMVEGTTQS